VVFGRGSALLWANILPSRPVQFLSCKSKQKRREHGIYPVKYVNDAKKGQQEMMVGRGVISAISFL